MTHDLRDRAAAEIRSAILTGTFRFGERLSDRLLADRFGISRTPVRDALSRLAEDGLVVVRPQSGTMVMNPDPDTICQCCETRAVIEQGALRLLAAGDPSGAVADCAAILDEARSALQTGDHEALDRLDTAFHETLVARTGNRFLVGCYRSISDFVAAIRYRLPREGTRYKSALKQHQRILDLLSQGHVDEAAQELATHVTHVARISSRSRDQA